MSNDYLNRLAISPEERDRLAGLGAANPLAVLGVRKAVPEAFDGLFEPGRAAQIAAQLIALLSEEELAVLNAAVPSRRPLGARLEEPPRFPNPAGRSKDEPS